MTAPAVASAAPITTQRCPYGGHRYRARRRRISRPRELPVPGRRRPALPARGGRLPPRTAKGRRTTDVGSDCSICGGVVTSCPVDTSLLPDTRSHASPGSRDTRARTKAGLEPPLPSVAVVAKSAPVDDVGPRSHRVSWSRPRQLALDCRKQKRTHRRQEWCFDRKGALSGASNWGRSRRYCSSPNRNPGARSRGSRAAAAVARTVEGPPNAGAGARDVPAPPGAWWFVRPWRDGLEPSGNDELAAGRPDCDAGAVGDQWDLLPALGVPGDVSVARSGDLRLAERLARS